MVHTLSHELQGPLSPILFYHLILLSSNFTNWLFKTFTFLNTNYFWLPGFYMYSHDRHALSPPGYFYTQATTLCSLPRLDPPSTVYLNISAYFCYCRWVVYIF